MSHMEIINSMSEDDALMALQAVRAICAGDIERANTALEAMSAEGLDVLISVLEGKIAEEGIKA